MNDPLIRLLAQIAAHPRSSGLELRSRLGLEKTTYGDLLDHLIRLGYLAPHATGDTCAPAGCDGCAIGCQSTPETGPRQLELTDRGRTLLSRSGLDRGGV